MDIIFHLGLHRTGTTFLQNEIFPKIEGLSYNVYRPDSPEYFLDKNKINLISREGLSGRPFASINLNALERDLFAYGISKKYPNSRIILGIRKKDDWLKSLYHYYVKGGGYMSYESWFNNFDKSYLDFERYIDLLNDLFDEVYVYNFEELRNNKKKCIQDLCDFIGLDPPSFEDKAHNKSWNKGKLWLGKLRGYLIRNSKLLIDEI
jgi:hypothetical protein